MIITNSDGINGNIGICETHVENQMLNRSFFRETGFSIATNSCSGEVQRYDYSSMTDGGFALIITSFVLIFIVAFVGILAWYLNH